MRLALDPGAGRNTVPVRSAILGAALAMSVVVATVVFGASLDTLVSRPALYGWNWTYALSAGNPTHISQQRAAALLDHDPDVSAWAGVYFATLEIDGQTVPVIGASPHALVAPPILTGHGLDDPQQVVLGAVTLAQLHKHLGETIEVGSAGRETGESSDRRNGHPSVARNQRVAPHRDGHGGAAFVHRHPGSREQRLGQSGCRSQQHLRAVAARCERRGGAAHAAAAGSRGERRRASRRCSARPRSSTTAPSATRPRCSAPRSQPARSARSASRSSRRCAGAAAISRCSRPSASPAASSPRPSRGKRASQSILGTVVGVPLGILAGRFLWDRFANALHVVPEPTVPALSIALIAVGAVLLANLVAAIPGRQAARTRTALLLHAE